MKRILALLAMTAALLTVSCNKDNKDKNKDDDNETKEALIKIDGQFGDGTREAVIAFQKARGLNADGIVGEMTREALWPATGEAE